MKGDEKTVFTRATLNITDTRHGQDMMGAKQGQYIYIPTILTKTN